MKKFFLLFLITFSFIKSYSQDFRIDLSIDICDCLNNVNNIDKKNVEKCVSQFKEKYKTLVYAYLDKMGLNKTEKEKFAIPIMLNKTEALLIRDCDSFYHYYDKQREKDLQSIKINNSLKKIDSLNTLLLKHNSIEALFERGKLYLANNRLRDAKRDFCEVLNIDPNHIDGIIYLGWIYEKQGKYRNAYDFYDQENLRTKYPDILTQMEFVIRKSRDRYSKK